MRRIVCGFLLVCMLFVICTPAFAETEAPVVMPRYSYISDLTYSLSINGSGTAQCAASASTYSTSNTVKIACNFQFFNGITWGTIGRWSDTDQYYASVSGQSSVRKGYENYRIEVICSVYDSSNNLKETVTEYEYDYYLGTP